MEADSPLPIVTSDALAPPAGSSTPIPIAWTAAIAAGPGGVPYGVIVFRNPAELTLTPDELTKSNRFESLGQLASGIAHDFNNHLTPILGAISLGIEQKDYSSLPDAEKACITAQGLTKQLLAFARGGSGTRVVCEPKTLMEHALKIGAAASAATITRRYAEPLANIRVDRAQLLQVFQNLIVNALQAMPPPPHRPALEIEIRNHSVAAGQIDGLVAGEYVEFEVRDNGSGIKPEHVGKIFDPYFTTKKHGTGLGLATVMRIVNKHGGQIALATEVGVGTAFTVYLPQADAEVELAPRRAAIMPYERTNRVLFMDDDAEIRRFTVALLAGLGYECDEAPNGETALLLFRKWVNLGKPHYDAVIMDLTVVGGMGGEECFAKLRELDPNVRGIVASGYDNDDMRQEFFAKGFLGYLTKPYRKQDLGKVLKEVIG
jgi:nitrogen-specific signal transduction histidine kinase/CheY-like chemotaxis protein